MDKLCLKGIFAVGEIEVCCSITILKIHNPSGQGN